MKDIFTLEEISSPKPEHVIPAGLGGRLESRTLIDGETNRMLGSTLEPVLLESLLPVRVGLGLQSRRRRSLKLEQHGKDVVLGPDWMPEISHRVGQMKNEGDQIQIVAATPTQAKKLLEGARRRYGNLGEVEAKIESKFVDVEFPLNLGGPIFFRAIAQTCLEFAALHMPREVICAPLFDEIRDWILHGAQSIEQLQTAGYTEHPQFVNWDARPELWAHIPLLPEAPFQHRLVFAAGPFGARALIELFGTLRFSCELATAPLDPTTHIHLIDPLGGARIDRAGLTTTCDLLANEVEVPPGQMDFESSRAGVRQLVSQLVTRHHAQARANMIEDAMREHFPAEGEIIQPAHIQAVAERLAEDFVRLQQRQDYSKEVGLDDLFGTKAN